MALDLQKALKGLIPGEDFMDRLTGRKNARVAAEDRRRRQSRKKKPKRRAQKLARRRNRR